MKNARQKELIRIMESKGFLETAAAAERFGVSLATIRRDLDDLEQEGLIEKKYGGAELVNREKADVLPYKNRQKIAFHEKEKMAEYVMPYIHDGSVIALDSGTTIFEVCKRMKEKKDILAICVDIHAATKILSVSKNKVYMMGGFLTPYGASSCDFAAEFTKQISSIDLFLCSADGIDPLSGFTSDEVWINDLKKYYISVAKKTIVLADHTKFTKSSFYRMCDFADIDLLVTDEGTPDVILSELAERGLKQWIKVPL